MQLGSKAVSPLIATVLVALFGVITLGIALGVVNPTFRRAQDTSAVNDQFATLETLNAAVKEVASEPDGSRRVVPITVTAGTLRVNSTYDWLYFEYEPLETLGISGTKGDIRIDQGIEFADYFNYYAEGSTATPTWTNTSGQAVASSGAYSITNGTSYHNVSGPFENWKFSATITNISGSTGGQVFALPTNPESLVGFWPFDNASGSVAYDYSGNGNTGTLTNMNTAGNSTSGWQDAANCKAGRSCLMFDGVNDYISLGNVLDNDLPSTPATVSVWVKGSFANGNQIVFGHYDSKIGLGFYVSGATNYFITRVGAGDSTKPTFNVNSVFVNDVWNHVLVVYDINGNPNLWLNGVNITTTGADNYWAWTVDEAAIGRRSTGNYFNGTIDEVMIFNRSLSADEVTALYETSTKKLDATGTQSIAAKASPAIVLANPVGITKFDDVTVTRDRNKLTLLVPFTNVELNGTLRLTKGEHKVQIRHMETNTTTSRPIVELTAV